MNRKILPTLLLLFISMLSQSVYGQKPLPKPIRPHKTVTKPKPSKSKPSNPKPSNPKPSNPDYTVMSSVSGSLLGYDYVDLGLPSGLKWAAYNVGSYSPEDYGRYYAWGEIASNSYVSDYTMENSRTYDKYKSDISGRSQYDAARYNWGGTWRLPTQREINELIEHCDYKCIIYKDIKGGLFISKHNGRVIFLPAAGYRNADNDNASLRSTGRVGKYWSSTPFESGESNDDLFAISFDFYDDRVHCESFDFEYRYHGLSVRPVSE